MGIMEIKIPIYVKNAPLIVKNVILNNCVICANLITILNTILKANVGKIVIWEHTLIK